MCGICGIVNRNTPPLQATLQQMCQTMIHRGPDEDGYFIQAPVGLGMRRLSIIDLTSGSQPIFNETQDIAIIFNGEIYNYNTLRSELVGRGHRFVTEGDTETIVHAYEDDGIAAIARLNGMFALALWDGRHQRLILARDRAGQKPLYYAHLPDGSLIFGSELKVILASGALTPSVNLQALGHYLAMQYVPSPETILNGIHQLPAGHTLVWEAGHIKIERYWQPSYLPKLNLSDAEWIQRTRATVTAAVERHMISDVPIGAFLSGGLDSSVVVAVMAQLASERVKTFSIGFDVAAYSETDHARRIAERYQTEHHEFIVSAQQVTDVLPQVVYYADQPLADTSLMATFLLAKLTREHVTVALTGDGGDEAFAGYTRYLLDKALAVYRRLPSRVRLQWVDALAKRLPHDPNVPTDRSWIAGLQRLGQASSVSYKASILAWGSFFTDGAVRQLVTPEVAAALGRTAVDVMAEQYDNALADSHLDRTLSADFITYLADDLLVKADRMSMGNSLETRAPFLDNEVLALALHMPERMRIRGTTQKVALRRAFADVIPPENVQRIKRGFGMPVGAWLRGHMAGYAREVLLDPVTLGRGLLRPEGVQTLLNDHMSGKADHGQRLWALLTLELWF
ncbi:MAG: asparagine synthase (glutamine-hydrolyzing), partial [Phototrophicaceae bacterium]